MRSCLLLILAAGGAFTAVIFPPVSILVILGFAFEQWLHERVRSAVSDWEVR